MVKPQVRGEARALVRRHDVGNDVAMSDAHLVHERFKTLDRDVGATTDVCIALTDWSDPVADIGAVTLCEPCNIGSRLTLEGTLRDGSAQKAASRFELVICRIQTS